jgi:site-specific DNA recombinase
MARSGSLTKRRRAHQTAITDNRMVAYIRASTDEQVNSLDAQAKRHRDFSQQRGILIDETFTDSGVSATAIAFLDRPAVKKMLAHMKKRGISHILLLRVDRVFRTTLDFTLSMVELEKRGLFLRFIDQDLDYSSPLGRMFIQQLVTMAEMEGRLRSQRQDDVFESLRESRIARVANALPYGWQSAGQSTLVSRSTGKPKLLLAPHHAEQAVLHHLHGLWEAEKNRHGCWTRLAAAMNRLGVPTKTGKPTWYPATVQSVLEHAELARPDELPDGIMPLDQAVSALRP